MRLVIITPAEEGGYTVEVPSLSGCISQGETVEEAVANIREAIALYIDLLKTEGRPVPPEEQLTKRTAAFV